MTTTEILATAFMSSLVGLALVLFYFGIRYIVEKLQAFRAFSSYKTDSERQIAEYKSQVENLKLEMKSLKEVKS